MAKPWQTIDSGDTDDGHLELRQRNGSDFLITIDGRVLMNSHASRSEILLSKLACNSMKTKKKSQGSDRRTWDGLHPEGGAR